MKINQAIDIRSKDAIARLMVEMLQVPTIYFDAKWPSSRAEVDILAIDRAGVGDVHIIEVKKTLDESLRCGATLMRTPAQFRWVAFYEPDWFKKLPQIHRKAEKAPLFAAERMGRLGVIVVYDEQDRFGDRLHASVVIRAERFAGSNYDEADKFVQSHKPDIMFR